MHPRRSRRVRPILGALAVAMTVAAGCGGPGIRVAEKARSATADGAIAPDFSAVDHRGETVVLSELARPNAIAVLVFYRGSW